jgi:hypothetical protein
MRIDRPGAAGAIRRYQSSKLRIRDHVDPGSRGPLSGFENNDVLAPRSRESAEAVEEFQIRSDLRRVCERRRVLFAQPLARRHGIRVAQSRQLIAQRARARNEDRASGGLQQLAIRRRHRIAGQQEHPPAARVIAVAAARRRGRDRGSQLALQFRRIRGRAFVEHDEVDGQSLRLPIAVRTQQLLDEFQLALSVDLRQHDRQITRNAEGRQRRRTQCVAAQDLARSAQR